MPARHDRIRKEFASRLARARVAAGYDSAQRFAGTLGLEPHTYRRYERGEAEPNFDVLLRICELLNTTPNDLITYRTLQTGHNPHSETA